MKKAQVLISSLLTTIMSATLIGGATYSLFTSESTHNITVSSAKVNVVSSIYQNKLDLYSLGVKQDTTFENGGTATISLENGRDITLDKMTPGDEIRFKVSIQNNSTVKVQYRVTMHVITSEFEDQLVFSGPSSQTWLEIAPGPTPIVTDEYSLLFKDTAGNAFQNKTAKVTIVVEASQANNDTLNKSTITLSDPEGETYEPITADIGSSVKLPTPEKVGYYFDGWFTAGGKKYSSEITMPAEDLHLTARYRIKRHSVYISPLYGLNSDLNPDHEQKITLDYGTPLASYLQNPIQLEGRTFSGYYKPTDTRHQNPIDIETLTMPDDDLYLETDYTINEGYGCLHFYDNLYSYYYSYWNQCDVLGTDYNRPGERILTQEQIQTIEEKWTVGGREFEALYVDGSDHIKWDGTIFDPHVYVIATFVRPRFHVVYHDYDPSRPPQATAKSATISPNLPLWADARGITFPNYYKSVPITELTSFTGLPEFKEYILPAFAKTIGPIKGGTIFDIGGGTTNIAPNTFDNTDLTYPAYEKITLNEGVKTIGNNNFIRHNASNLVLPNSFTNIGDNFLSIPTTPNSKLEVYFPENFVSFGENCFNTNANAAGENTSVDLIFFGCPKNVGTLDTTNVKYRIIGNPDVISQIQAKNLFPGIEHVSTSDLKYNIYPDTENRGSFGIVNN